VLYSLSMKTGYWLPEYRSFLKKLTDARAEAQLTQSQVAKILKKSQSFIAKCENGERRVDALELQKAAGVFFE
jgi:transcriptional regulator with XRE-family HTH domain